jgi:hypothetical protein
MPAGDRVRERRKAAALARHYRDEEGLSIAEIARRLGRAKATVKAYLYDPIGEKALAVWARYVGVCGGCGMCTQLRNGKDDAYQYRSPPGRRPTSPAPVWPMTGCATPPPRTSSPALRRAPATPRRRGATSGSDTKAARA